SRSTRQQTSLTTTAQQRSKTRLVKPGISIRTSDGEVCTPDKQTSHTSKRSIRTSVRQPPAYGNYYLRTLQEPCGREESQSRGYNCRFQRLRSDLDADRDILTAFFAIRDFCVSVNFEFAFNGRVLVDEERHGFGFNLLHQLMTCGSLTPGYR